MPLASGASRRLQPHRKNVAENGPYEGLNIPQNLGSVEEQLIGWIRILVMEAEPVKQLMENVVWLPYCLKPGLNKARGDPSGTLGRSNFQPSHSDTSTALDTAPPLQKNKDESGDII